MQFDKCLSASDNQSGMSSERLALFFEVSHMLDL